MYIYGGSPSRAIDGNLNSNWLNRSCTHTTEVQNPWWSVDFNGMYYVHAVNITNRANSQGDFNKIHSIIDVFNCEASYHYS